MKSSRYDLERKQACVHACPGFNPDIMAGTEDYLKTIPEAFRRQADIDEPNCRS